MKNFFSKITVFLIILLISSCNAVKRVEDGELLLTKNTIYINDEKIKNEELDGLISQKPNSPLRLAIYNLAKKNSDSIYLARLQKQLDSANFWKSVLSEKQLIRLAEYKIDFNNWLRNSGEAPVIINEEEAEKSSERLSKYAYNFGYFNNTTSFEIDTTKRKRKRAEISYKINTGEPYIIDSLTTEIVSDVLDSIYKAHQNLSIIKSGDQFNLNNFSAERERLNDLYLNSGIYRFQRTSITYDIQRDTIEANEDYQMPTTIIIDNAYERVGDSLREIPYKVHSINNVNIFTDTNIGAYTDTIQYDNYTIYYKDELRYKPKALTDAVAIIPGDIYKDQDRTLTYRQISNLKIFRYPTIEYTYTDSSDSKLNSNIYITSRPKFSLGLNTDISHSNIQDIGMSFGTSLLSRNVFRGAETLELALKGTIGSSRELRDEDDPFFNILEFGGDINLNFPRFLLPFNTDKYVPKYMNPNTRLSAGITTQKNIGLDKQSLNSLLRYTWDPSSYQKNIFELINIQFVKNLNPERYYLVYRNSYDRLNDLAAPYENQYPEFYKPDTESPQLVIPEGTNAFINAVDNGDIVLNNIEDQEEFSSIAEQEERLTTDNLIFASNFTYTKNNRKSYTDNNFYQFRTKIELAGNLLSGIASIFPFDEDENGNNLVFGVPYSQYVKSEFDFIKHWRVFKTNTLAFRAFTGIAIPYGNSNNIPFIRSYFAGGSNDNRAWQPYSLGPGRTDNLEDYNEANFKIAFNLEYRFNILGDLKGALFVDSGNIWNVLDEVESEERVFEGFKSLSELAIGSGFGVRYDFSFFVIRLDTGFKTYNPALEKDKRWFNEYNFRNAVLNIGINYPF
ncbi:translocation and assembly module lipoprotein TamL [Zhouia amylolytica]|uniref:translocation and assembly module lipoprotein TamL n=1 Tax=Zhouia amylolytica TaxID=376730 RepID=UPI0009425BDE|nr:BamA/TamA family outer membrane protein [Zhouia amylolytica]